MDTCAALEEALPGKVFYPEKTGFYGDFKQSYFSAFENELSPSCVVRPHNGTDVSKIIRAVRQPGLSGRTRMAIRSGGHATPAEFANIEDGITIDLRSLNGVELKANGRIASIGPGAQWGDVYQSLETENLAVSGGRVSKVGIGGLTTGGGLSYFSAARGFVCDDVLSFEIVLANGKLVQATADENSNLFYALKGGTNNFGIVTRIDLPTFKQGKMWGGAIYYLGSAYPELIKDFVDFASDTSPDENAHIIVGQSFSNHGPGKDMGELGVSNLYYAESTPKPRALEPFTEIQPQLMNTLRNDSLRGFTEEQSAFSTNGARQWFFTTAFKLNYDLMLDIRKLWEKSYKDIKDTDKLTYSLVFQPVTRGLLEASRKKGGNSLGLEPQDGPFVVCLLNTVHGDADDDETVIKTVRDLVEDIDRLSARRNKDIRYRFTNYAFKHRLFKQNPIKAYGPEVLRRFQAVSQEYDPDGFFQKMVPGGFKLADALAREKDRTPLATINNKEKERAPLAAIN